MTLSTASTIHNAPVPQIIFIKGGAHGDGAIKPIMENVAKLIETHPHLWDLRFNDFAARVTLNGQYVTDADDLTIARWVQQNGVFASVKVIHDGIMVVAQTRRHNPVKEYLDSLTWDGIPRLDALFIDHAGSTDTALIRAFSGRWFIQAVARIYEPGCQADATLVLEGRQGLLKSTVLRVLFGDLWFTDHLPDITNKDSLLQLRGVWCVEISEFASLGRAEAARIKQFLTSRVDRYRDPYGRMVADYPRSCVFAGTINPGAGGYLKDETGARRFWPVPINQRIDTGAIAAVRDQIWAEAVVRYQRGEPWHLDTDALITAADEATADRFVSDPWDGPIADYVGPRTETSLREILRDVLGIEDQSRWSQRDQNRVARCLTRIGWKRFQKRINGKPEWLYHPMPSPVRER